MLSGVFYCPKDSALRMLVISCETTTALRILLPPFEAIKEAINCHHNYVAKEHHFDADVYVTRKGAIRAGQGRASWALFPAAWGPNPSSYEARVIPPHSALVLMVRSGV